MSDNYTPSTSRSAYFPAGSNAVARLWAREKLVHDLGDMGVISYFEGIGDDPTGISGYSSNKLWLRPAAAGITTETGTIRYYAGGTASLLANWPVLTKSAFSDHLLGSQSSAIDITDYGAVGDGVVDCTSAIQAAIDACPDGGALFIPRGDYNLLGSGAQALLIGSTNKTIHIFGHGHKSRLVMASTFPNTRDVIRIAPTTGTAYWSLKNFAIVPSSGSMGRDAIRIDTQDATEQAYFFDIENLVIGSMDAGFSIHHLSSGSNATGGMPYSKVTNCKTANGMKFVSTGDKIIVSGNTIDATDEACIETGRIVGAAQFTIQDNLLISRAYGAIIINSFVHPQIIGNEIEQIATLSSANAVIDIQGDLESVDTPIISRNSIAVISSVTGTCPAIRLDTCKKANVENNWISVRGSNKHVICTANSVDPYIGINTYIADDIPTYYAATTLSGSGALVVSRGASGGLLLEGQGGVNATSGFYPLSANVASLGAAGVEFLNIHASGNLVFKGGALALANGANSNVTLPTASFITITGPTGAFSVSGFASPVDGRKITLYNSVAFDMTITNDATSTAANRILTLTGADVTLTGVSVVEFVYSAVSTRWILTGARG